MSCYVEFTCCDDSRVVKLREFIASVEANKNLPSTDSAAIWIRFFTDEQLSAFWWPASDEAEATKKTWGEVPVFKVAEERSARDWDIYSMVETLLGSEYTLLGVSVVDAARRRIDFHPSAFPFGGTESLQRLVRAFGGVVVAVDDGTGRVDVTGAGSPRKKWWEFWK